MLLFAQQDANSPPEPDFGPYIDPALPIDSWSWWGYSPLLLTSCAFWLWMLIDCIRNDSERHIWIWILIFVLPGFVSPLPLGAVIYFLIRWLPRRNPHGSRLLRRWTRGRDLPQLEAAARQIGNPHQFVLLGDALRELGRHERAAAAYARALEKDGVNLQALWGAALVDMNRQQFGPARERLEKILSIDPSYKFGDVSLAYGRALAELKETDAAREHLTKHVRRWKQPEAHYLLASLLADQNRPEEARQYLEAMLLDLSGAPSFFVRQNRGWRSKARRLLARLPRSTPASRTPSDR